MITAPSLAVFRHRAYAQYWAMRIFGGGAMQMLATTIGWQVYELARETRSVREAGFILGLVGLAQFLPLLLFSLVGGVAADRLDRKLILTSTFAIRCVIVTGLFVVSAPGFEGALPAIFVAAVILGSLNAFFPAASSALLPRLVPREELPQAIAWSSIAFQTAAVLGPAVAGGLLLAGGTQTVYASCIVLLAAAGVLIGLAPTPHHVRVEGGRTAAMILEGLRYVRDNKIVLGAILLDLVVVLFGGVMALLPVFARDILHVDEGSLGLMRAAPAAGAVVVALGLAARGLTRHVGRWMVGSIAVFGVASLVFAFSTALWLTLAALVIRGAADMISVYVRQSLIQLATPDAMRGRVSSVSYIFISASNELGEFEAGVATRLVGPIGAVVLGGAVALGSALSWPRLFPKLVKADRFEDAAISAAPTPAPEGVAPAKRAAEPAE